MQTAPTQTVPPQSAPPAPAGRTYPQVPVLEMPVAIAVLLVNLFIPGIGTIIAGVVGKQPLIGRGIAQLLLTLIFVGWVWALITSIQCLTNANQVNRVHS